MRAVRSGDYVRFRSFTGSEVVRIGVVETVTDAFVYVQQFNGKGYEVRRIVVQRIIPSFVGWVPCAGR